MWDPGRNRRLPVTAEINITSLVDVAFTLLVIFIITAPILQGGVEIELPKTTTEPITQADAPIVTVRSDGTLFVGEVEVAGLAEFERVFPEYARDLDTEMVYIRGDREAVYGRVMQVIGALNRLGFSAVGLVSEPEVAAAPE